MVPNLPMLVLFLGFVCAFADLAQGAAPGIDQLPPHLRFEEGKINLVADYAAADGHRVPVYAVNATDAPKRLDDDLPVMRETLGKDGQWRRCSAYLPPLPCVLSENRTVDVPPWSFHAEERMLVSGKGEVRPVRFRQFTHKGPTDLISNEGFGVVDPEEFEACRFDYFGVKTGPFEDVARVAMDEAPLMGRPNPLREMAVHRIEQWQGWPNRIEVLKDAIAKAKAANEHAMYRFTLDCLRSPSPPEWTHESYWKFAMQELESSAPLASVAFDSLIYAPFFKERKRPLLDRIIADPRHPCLERAIQAYPDVAGEAAAKKMAQRISRSSKYPDHVKKAPNATRNR